MERDSLSWAEIEAMARDLEIVFRWTEAGDVEMEKYQGPWGWFQESEAGRMAAVEWLQQYRRYVEASDEVSRMKPVRRKRFLGLL